MDAVYAVLTVVSTTTVGALVASRRPRHPVGWLLAAYGLLLTISWVACGYLTYGCWPACGAAGHRGRGSALLCPLNVSGAPVPFLALALLLTPTGSLPSRRWRWVTAALVSAAVGIALGTPLDAKPLDPPLQSVTSPLALDLAAGPLLVRIVYDVARVMVFVAFVGGIVAAAGSLVLRFRRAGGWSASSCDGWRWRRRWSRWRP